MKEPILSITAVILCRNEEERISNCLNSVTWCDEIIVVDDYSTDQTIQVIESFKQKNNQVRLYQRSLKADFAGQRNFSLSKVKNKWVLFIDADEIVSSPLRKEIKEELALSNDRNIEAYLLK